MKQIRCPNCGSDDFIYEQGVRICRYCLSRYAAEASDTPPKSSGLSLEDDIRLLLQKCRKDPANARRYAGLVLDIDPTNREARKYFDE